MGDRRIHDDGPERTEQKHGAKFHALGIGPDDQRGRDDGEGHLKHEKDSFGNIAAQGAKPNAAQEDLAESPDHRVEVAAIAERETVDEDEPKNRNRTANREAVHQDRDHVLGTDEAAVK